MARAGEIWSGFSFPIDVRHGFFFPGDRKKKKKKKKKKTHRPLFLIITHDENELLRVVAIK